MSLPGKTNQRNQQPQAAPEEMIKNITKRGLIALSSVQLLCGLMLWPAVKWPGGWFASTLFVSTGTTLLSAMLFSFVFSYFWIARITEKPDK